MKYLALFALLFVCGVMADDKIGHNMCKCHIQVADQPEDKKLILDVFKNDVHIDACNDAGLEHCKKFCLDTEKEKTNGDLKTVSKISNIAYGEIMCQRLGRDVEAKELSMVAEVVCKDNKKMIDTGLKFPQQLTCKDGKFVM